MDSFEPLFLRRSLQTSLSFFFFGVSSLSRPKTNQNTPKHPHTNKTNRLKERERWGEQEEDTTEDITEEVTTTRRSIIITQHSIIHNIGSVVSEEEEEENAIRTAVVAAASFVLR